jgi:hypothetical protein
MVKTYTCKKISRSPKISQPISKVSQNSSNTTSPSLFSNATNKRGGRPKKQPIPIDSTPKYTYQNIVEKPERIQSYDQFAFIPQLFLIHGYAGTSRHKFINYLKSTNQEFPPFIPYNLNRGGVFLGRFDVRQRFFKFLTLVNERTSFNLGLNDEIVNLLNEMAEAFSFSSGSDAVEGIRSIFLGNSLKRDEVYYFMDSFLFDQIIKIFGAWRNVFYEKIDAS